MRVLWVLVGGIITLIGLVWALQGAGILGGSVMSGRGIFIVIGLLVVVAGLALVGVGVRRLRTPTA